MTKIENILRAIKEDLLPLTRKGVEEGNHVFGGLVLDAGSLKTIVAGTNNRQGNPIFHGEIDTIMRFFSMKDHPDPSECIFVASHDPCSMCISAIAWSGFKEIWVLFGYEDVAKDFEMPVDLIMYKEIFGAEGAKEKNLFFRKYSIKHELEKEPDPSALMEQINEIANIYSSLEVKDFNYPGMQSHER
ncbi:MAG: deaminase [Synergistaceae bacterium]|nr:deaminase [Synergistaceae bacterium]